jgi:hypothetical protein
MKNWIKNNFDIVIGREWTKGFSIGIMPVWFHRHNKGERIHFHFLVDLFFWFIEIRIGKEF